MAWQTPKTNWATGDIPVADDFNRIEGNVQELQNTKETPAGAQAKANTAEANAKAYTDAHEQKAAPHSGHETPAGAQAKAEAAAGAVQADLDAHLAETVPHPNLSLTDAQHGNLSGGSLHAAATTSANGFMSSLDKQQMEGNSGLYTISYVNLAGKATRTYTIPLGYAATRGRLALVNTDMYVPKGIAWFNKVANDATGISSTGTVSNRGVDGKVLFATNIWLRDAYISGTSLRLEFYNVSSSTYGLAATVCWEVT